MQILSPYSGVSVGRTGGVLDGIERYARAFNSALNIFSHANGELEPIIIFPPNWPRGPLPQWTMPGRYGAQMSRAVKTGDDSDHPRDQDDVVMLPSIPT